MDQQIETRVTKEKLRKALVALANKLSSSNDVCLLKFILFGIEGIPDADTALKYFNIFLQLQKITINDVSMIYEILMLMRKNQFWTEFREELIDGGGIVPDYGYFGKQSQLSYFSEFRVVMIKAVQQVREEELFSIKVLYEIEKDVTNIWTTFLHLERNREVTQTEKSLLNLAKNFKTAKNVQAGNIIKQYVEKCFLCKSTTIEQRDCCDGEMKEHINATKFVDRKSSQEHDFITLEVNERISRVETMEKKINDTADECKRCIKHSGELLKTTIDKIVSIQTDEIEKNKLNKLKKLKQISKGLKDMKGEPLILQEVENVYPESVGYFTHNIKIISDELKRFEKEVNKYFHFVNYSPVDPDKCKITFPEQSNRCFEINEVVEVKVELKDSNGDSVREHESVPITVNVEQDDAQKGSKYELTKEQKRDDCTLKFKFKSTGLWRLCVFVCGEKLSKPQDEFKIISENALKETVPLSELDGQVFDVCFAPSGKCHNLLACNFTCKIFSISNCIKVFASIGENKQVANLCSIDNGDIFLTEITNKEIVVLNCYGKEQSCFGRGNFEGGSPQGIAATYHQGEVHVFVSNTNGECVNYYVDEKFRKTIGSISEPFKPISPWFLDVNTDLLLFICNNKPTSSGQHKTNRSNNVCVVEIHNVKSKSSVASLKCDSAVCIDEKGNVFIGMKFGIKMFDKQLKFITEVTYNGDSSFGMSAFDGRLAVVYPGSIKIYQYW